VQGCNHAEGIAWWAHRTDAQQWIWSAGEWSTSFQNALEESSSGLACPTPGDRIPQPGPARFIRRGRSSRCASGAGGRSFSLVPQSFNLSTAVEQELARHRSFLSLPRHIGTSAAPLEGGACASQVVRSRQRIVHERRVAKQALFETVQALHASGKTVSGIVRETGISRQRVSAWVGLVELPERNRMAPNRRTPAFYEDHLARRYCAIRKEIDCAQSREWMIRAAERRRHSPG
jgi:hypothetical protein